MRNRLTQKPSCLALCAALVLLASLLFGLAACSGDDGGSDDMTPAPGDETVGGGLDEAMIKNLTSAVSDFTPEQIQVAGYETFGEWAAAYVSVEGQEGQLAVFRFIEPSWTLYDIGSYMDPDDLGPQVPQELKDWAF